MACQPQQPAPHSWCRESLSFYCWLMQVSEDGKAEPPAPWIKRPKPKKAVPRTQPVDAPKDRGSKRGKFAHEPGQLLEGSCVPLANSTLFLLDVALANYQPKYECCRA